MMHSAHMIFALAGLAPQEMAHVIYGPLATSIVSTPQRYWRDKRRSSLLNPTLSLAITNLQIVDSDNLPRFPSSAIIVTFRTYT